MTVAERRYALTVRFADYGFIFQSDDVKSDLDRLISLTARQRKIATAEAQELIAKQWGYLSFAAASETIASLKMDAAKREAVASLENQSGARVRERLVQKAFLVLIGERPWNARRPQMTSFVCKEILAVSKNIARHSKIFFDSHQTKMEVVFARNSTVRRGLSTHPSPQISEEFVRSGSGGSELTEYIKQKTDHKLNFAARFMAFTGAYQSAPHRFKDYAGEWPLKTATDTPSRVGRIWGGESIEFEKVHSSGGPVRRVGSYGRIELSIAEKDIHDIFSKLQNGPPVISMGEGGIAWIENMPDAVEGLSLCT